MVERDPIDLIKEQLNRADGMAGLHPDHETFKQWYNEIKTILEKAFSSKSIHYQNFLALRFREMNIKAFASPEIDKINSSRYKRDLDNVKNILQSAIKELTLDRTLFRKIQTTPITVEVNGGYHDFGKLMEGLDKMTRMVVVTDLNMSSAKVEGKKMNIPVKVEAAWRVFQVWWQHRNIRPLK